MALRMREQPEGQTERGILTRLFRRDAQIQIRLPNIMCTAMHRCPQSVEWLDEEAATELSAVVVDAQRAERGWASTRAKFHSSATGDAGLFGVLTVVCVCSTSAVAAAAAAA
eukprot:CAMPEP_0183340842 /NCGR_PEP_ID=MMETSP0164_2-20130417/7260_1 /TAXON_ID=221442 /ORGANISM="Coccolithus pelagicus ssp braarudi, Strain PLY182g" /LENGTH=111 /DNA_ID=CAMNT_0025511043 /DNA_START=616 /DNA_END=948 /DNA_ORIENTATION=+